MILVKAYKKLRRIILPEYSAREREIKYWKGTGIKKGHNFYKKYLDKFSVDKKSLLNSAISDFGCGPLAGIFSVIKDCKAAYPIDVLANLYNSWGSSRFKIYRFNGRRTILPPGIVDVMFCCNTIDHSKQPRHIVNEIGRLLKANGTLFLHVHLRGNKELNVAHPIAWTEQFFTDLFKKQFRTEWQRIKELDEVNQNAYRTLYAKLIKI